MYGTVCKTVQKRSNSYYDYYSLLFIDMKIKHTKLKQKKFSKVIVKQKDITEKLKLKI